jgi:hypothetical protein
VGWRGAGALAIGLLVALACSDPFGNRPIRIKKELTPEEVTVAEQLAGRVSGGQLPEEIASDCAAHLGHFVWLAARSPDPGVVIAAMSAAAPCAVAEGADPVHRDDLAQVVARRLSDPDPGVVLAAFSSADELVAPLPPEHPLVVALVSLATDRRLEVRYEALLALDRRAWVEEPLVSIAFLHALQASDAPWLVTEVLRRLRYRATGLGPSPSFRSACLVLTQDLDPGIRGRAALVLARLDPNDEQIRSTLLRMLDDPHGYVRSAVAEALGEVGDPGVIPEIVRRIEDPARNTWDMLPFTRLDGTSEVPHHVGSHFERVDDAYLRALEVLSAPMGEQKFVYREISLRYRDLDIIAATRDAKRWYEANAASIPGPAEEE